MSCCGLFVGGVFFVVVGFLFWFCCFSALSLFICLFFPLVLAMECNNVGSLEKLSFLLPFP